MILMEADIIQLPADDENLIRVTKMYGNTHTIQAIKGTKVHFNLLPENQEVCWGDGKTYHFRLTEKKEPIVQWGFVRTLADKLDVYISDEELKEMYLKFLENVGR